MSVHNLTEEVVILHLFHFFVAAHCFSSLQLEQILLHNWVCHCVWMGSSHGSNERASLCARFSELSSRELNFWATHPEGMGSPFVGVTAVTLIDCCWKCENVKMKMLVLGGCLETRPKPLTLWCHKYPHKEENRSYKRKGIISVFNLSIFLLKAKW